MVTELIIKNGALTEQCFWITVVAAMMAIRELRSQHAKQDFSLFIVITNILTSVLLGLIFIQLAEIVVSWSDEHMIVSTRVGILAGMLGSALSYSGFTYMLDKIDKYSDKLLDYIFNRYTK